MLFRSWLTFSFVIAVVQMVLAGLSVLQHDAIFSDLLRQRVSVIAQTTATAFKPLVDLGMPLSMMRNGDAVVARALDTDPEIEFVHAFDASGAIVHSTMADRPQSVPPVVLKAMRLATAQGWSAETSQRLYSGFDIKSRSGEIGGGVVVGYPRDRLEEVSQAIVRETAWTALAIWAVFSALAWPVLRLLLGAPQRALGRLEKTLLEPEGRREPVPGGGGAELSVGARGLFGPEIERLGRNLDEAGQQYARAREDLDGAAAGRVRDGAAGSEGGSLVEGAEVAVRGAADPSRSLARRVATRLAPVAALFILLSALLLGLASLRDVNQSIEPELAARTHLIGSVVSDNVQRALAAGVPLDRLVGAESFFGDMLTRLPEVAYIAVATGRIVLEAGERIDPYLAPARERKDVRSHPIMQDGEEIAYVVIDIDPAIISKRFVDVFLDMSVVVLVSVLIAFEIMVLLTSRSLTAGLDRLQRLAAMQAAGDFSRRAGIAASGSVDRMTRLLADRAVALNGQFARLWSRTRSSAGGRAALEQVAQRHALSSSGAVPLRTTYFTDLRLALFLFAAADHLPLVFLPLYTRAAEASWLPFEQAVLLSLPLAGYLLAIVLVSPLARPLAEWLGRRPLLVLATIPALVAHIGLFYATSVPEIVGWRVLTGLGYALVTLACQDYVLDTVTGRERAQAMGLFTTVLFAGIFSGTALGGVLADRLGQENVFLLSAALVAAAAVLVARLVGPADSGIERPRARMHLPPILPTLRSRRFCVLLFGIAIPNNIVLQAFISYLVTLILDSLGASTADIGRSVMLYFLAVIVVGPVAGRLASRWMSMTSLALLGATLGGSALLMAALVPHEVTVLLAIMGAGVGDAMGRVSLVPMAMNVAENELQHLGPNAVLGTLRTLERVGSIAGLLAVAMVAGQFGYAAGMATVAALSLGGAALFGAHLGAGRKTSAVIDPAR
ncbi:MFS transporter [Marinimicrococcus flavescens]|uniref:MFS transporter n=1 Tax=Marinimicrococcus flavescens TaxID=3031815 RepID=A0AAP3UZM8_9PROT|nr:MFS transporter [Marinimicrococcus flavescens]